MNKLSKSERKHIENLYNEHLDTLKKLAWYHSKRKQINYDDLLLEATDVLIDCALGFDWTNGTKFKTYLINCVNNKFKNLRNNAEFKATTNRASEFEYHQIQAYNPSPERTVIFKDALFKMSGEAKEVAELIIRMPVDFINFLNGDKPGRTNIKKFLNKKRGVPVRTVMSAFHELNDMLDNI